MVLFDQFLETSGTSLDHPFIIIILDMLNTLETVGLTVLQLISQ